MKTRANLHLEIEMSGSTVVAGLIVFLLGVVGLMQMFGSMIIPFDLAVVSAFLTVTGAIVLFGVIALVGLIMIIGGLASLGEPRPQPIPVVQPTVVQPAVVVAQPAPGEVVRPAPPAYVLSDLEVATLRYVSQGKTAREIASATGVSEPIIADKIAMLRSQGYLTDRDALTEKGFEAVRASDQRTVYTQPAP